MSQSLTQPAISRSAISQAFQRGAIALAFKTNMVLRRLGRRIGARGKPHISAIDHVTIPVHDLETAQHFYCELLGGALLARVDNDFFRKVGRPVYDDDAQGVFHISILFGGPTRVDLFQQRYGQAGAAMGHPHYAFAVWPKDMPKWKARLAARGIPFDGPLQLGPPGQASLYFNDPFGNHLELTTMGYGETIPQRPPEMARLAWPETQAANA